MTDLLSGDEVRQMLRERCRGRLQKDVAADFGISAPLLSRMIRGKCVVGGTILRQLGLKNIRAYTPINACKQDKQGA